MYRKGDEQALVEFSRRLFSMRYYFCQKAGPDIHRQMDDWSLNEAFFHAYMKCVQHYEFQRVKFTTFFTHVLSHEMIRLLKIQKKESGGQIYSLDEYLGDEGDPYTLRDIIPSGDFKDDPAAFLSYAESLRRIGKLPKGIQPSIIDAIELLTQGYLYEEVAERMKISVANLRYRAAKFRKWAISVIASTYNLDKKSIREKEKILNRFLKIEEVEDEDPSVD